jgi:hypothetical protein
VLNAAPARSGVTPTDPTAVTTGTPYLPDDVTVLFRDLTGVLSPLPMDEVAAISRATNGTGHRSVVPVEEPPTAATLALYDRLEIDRAAEVALLAHVVARQLADEHPDGVVLASVARAGTPVGVVLHRVLRDLLGHPSAHYTFSFLPNIALDEAALRHIVAHHNPADVRFVDGWSGKGGVARHLAAALAEAAPRIGADLNPELVLLSDPGAASTTVGTRADVLLPSAVLNAPVSGLLSRSVTIADGDGRHGAITYEDLRPYDRSLSFVDAVLAAAAVTDARSVDAALTAVTAAGPATFHGWAYMEQLATEFAMPNMLNFVKPGLNETCRALVARKPARILLDPTKEGEDTAVIRHLADEKHVPIEERHDMPYTTIGLAEG